MKTNIKAKGFDLTPSIKEYIEKKIGILDKILVEYLEKDTIEINFEVARTTKHHQKGDVFYAEANMALPEKLIRADSRAHDLRMAIDDVRRTLQREIKKYKEKRR